jgi:HAE1 family hydrophobic/amphiphilic exporter-1
MTGLIESSAWPTEKFTTCCHFLIRKIVGRCHHPGRIHIPGGIFGNEFPEAFCRTKIRAISFAQVILPDAASFQRTDGVMKQCEEVLKNTPGISVLLHSYRAELPEWR